MDNVRAEADAAGINIYDYMAANAGAGQQLDALRAAVAELQGDWGDWRVPWGEVNRYQRINGDIVQQFNDEEESWPVGFASGRWGALASFGSRKYPGTRRMYGTSGNSFVAVVEFGDPLARQGDHRRRPAKRSGFAAFRRPGGNVRQRRIPRRAVLPG